MSSKYLTILPAVAALLLSAACSQDDLTGSTSLSEGAYPLEIGSVSITAEVDEGSSTRVSESTDGASSVFQENDAVTVQLGDQTATYTIADNNLTSTSPLYWQNTLDATVAAWYPSNVSEAISLADQSKALAYVISASTTGNYQSPVSLTFSHQLAKVRIKLSGTVASSITSVEVYSSTSCSFDPTTQMLTAGEEQAYIKMMACTYEEGDETFACWEANVVPGEIATPGTFIRLNGSIIVPFSAITELVAGNVYTIDITIGDVDIQTASDGTVTYVVYTKAGLLQWAEAAASNLSINCTLAVDIDITGETWTAVGDSENQYTGTFDGNGHTITGLTISTSGANQGLIGNLGSDGVVKNLTMEGVSISGINYVGAVVGYNDGTVTDCSSTGSVTGQSEIGGVVGINMWGTITACSSTAAVSGTEMIGGVVGRTYRGTITACYSTGSVTGQSEIGGVVGINMWGTITACYSTGSVSGSGTSSMNIGGVVGSNEGTVTTCYWYNSLESGIGEDMVENSETTKVDGTNVTWTTAKDAMNTALTNANVGWQYDGDGTDDPPLTLVEEE